MIDRDGKMCWNIRSLGGIYPAGSTPATGQQELVYCFENSIVHHAQEQNKIPEHEAKTNELKATVLPLTSTMGHDFFMTKKVRTRSAGQV